MSSSNEGSSWKERQEIPDEQVRAAADQFDTARKLLDAMPPGSGVLLPLLNCAAVALELYLKSLCAVMIDTPLADGEGLYTITAKAKAKGHGLTDQLKHIPNHVRESLDRAYAAASPGRVLSADLEEYEHIFEASRYAFEKDMEIDKYPLHRLMRLLWLVSFKQSTQITLSST